MRMFVRRGHCLGSAAAAVVILLVLLLVSSGGSSMSSPGSGGPGPGGAASSVQAYTVTFTETGLPAGTAWNVTLNGTAHNTTGPTIVFSEPDGSYLFFVGAVPGYDSNPEGNVTVNGGPVTVPILFVSTAPVYSSCSSFSWVGKNYVFYGDCRGSFGIDYRSLNSTTGILTNENSTFAIGAVAGVASNGVVDALGLPGYEGSGLITVTPTPSEITMTDVITGNVTTAVGLNATTGLPDGQTPLWTPAQAPGGDGATYWGPGNQILGLSTLTVVFHFSNESGNTSDRVEFAVSVTGWPWVSANDVLGIELGATAETATYFAYSTATSTLSEMWDASGAVATNLTFGPVANTTGGSASELKVTEQVALQPGGPTPTVASVLLTFNGPGGYSNLTYDPWIIFGPSEARTIVAAATLPILAVGAIVVAVGGLGWVAYRARRKPIEEGLL